MFFVTIPIRATGGSDAKPRRGHYPLQHEVGEIDQPVLALGQPRDKEGIVCKRSMTHIFASMSVCVHILVAFCMYLH
jgi:hypothetical protein